MHDHFVDAVILASSWGKIYSRIGRSREAIVLYRDPTITRIQKSVNKSVRARSKFPELFLRAKPIHGNSV